MNEHLALLARIRCSGPGSSPPGQDDLKRHLSGRLQQIGAPALMEFAYVQQVAAEVWGAERCAHFANVLREATNSLECRAYAERHPRVERLGCVLQSAGPSYVPNR